jgi:hypothetical protein
VNCAIQALLSAMTQVGATKAISELGLLELTTGISLFDPGIYSELALLPITTCTIKQPDWLLAEGRLGSSENTSKLRLFLFFCFLLGPLCT